jgi:hypothetical protein
MSGRSRNSNLTLITTLNSLCMDIASTNISRNNSINQSWLVSRVLDTWALALLRSINMSSRDAILFRGRSHPRVSRSGWAFLSTANMLSMLSISMHITSSSNRVINKAINITTNSSSIKLVHTTPTSSSSINSNKCIPAIKDKDHRKGKASLSLNPNHTPNRNHSLNHNINIRASVMGMDMGISEG